MTKVITELEMKEYSGMSQAVFTADTIITPSAREWAKDHGLRIIFSGDIGDLQKPGHFSEIDRSDLLKKVVMSVKTQLEKDEVPIKKDEIVQAVLSCLERIGCQIT